MLPVAHCTTRYRAMKSSLLPLAHIGHCGLSGTKELGFYALKRPAKPRRGKSALVTSPGGAATTDLMALRAGRPVTVIPMEAKLSGLDRSTPCLGKIMCLL